jgi:hypothetical protein
MKRVFIYSLTTLALMVAMNAYVANHPLYQGKTGRIDRVYEELDEAGPALCPATGLRTLVLGNSYVDRSFLPGDADCRFVKFTVAGMPLRDAARIVVNLRPEQRIGRVVVGVGYNDANPVESDSSVYMRYWATTPWTNAVTSRSYRPRNVAHLVKEDFVPHRKGTCARAI